MRLRATLATTLVATIALAAPLPGVAAPRKGERMGKLRLASKTLLPAASPLLHATYLRPQGIAMINPWGYSADNGRTWSRRTSAGSGGSDVQPTASRRGASPSAAASASGRGRGRSAVDAGIRRVPVLLAVDQRVEVGRVKFGLQPAEIQQPRAQFIDAPGFGQVVSQSPP